MDGLGSYARFKLLYLRASKQNSVMKRSIHRHVLQFYVRSMTFLDLYLEQTIHCTYLLSKYYLKLCNIFHFLQQQQSAIVISTKKTVIIAEKSQMGNGTQF